MNQSKDQTNIFSDYLLEEMKINPKIFVITADIGYGVLDEIIKVFPDRFINVGAAENLMIGVAVGLCYEGYIPICYTISTFLLYRPFEMIRNYVNHENLNIKLVGAGRNKDYFYHEFTHWAEDDVTVVKNCFSNINIFKPRRLTKEIFNNVINSIGPCYLNLRKKKPKLKKRACKKVYYYY